METIVTTLGKGINTDVAKEYTKDSTLFALNAIDESEEGNIGLLGNEGSNELVNRLDRVILGTCVMDDENVIVFSSGKNEEDSEIGVYNSVNREYKVYCNDYKSKVDEKLNFRHVNPIFSTYRVRKGCYRTVYFVDGYNKPRHFCFDDIDAYKSGTRFVSSRFNIEQSYKKSPKMVFDIIEGDGNLASGQYFFAIQYCNKEGFGASWCNISKGVIVYKENMRGTYSKIYGSKYNSNGTFDSEEKTNKSISIDVHDLDEDYEFYRLAFICANNGSGQVNKVMVSDIIPASIKRYVFSGDNYSKETTLADIIIDQEQMATANVIEQYDQRLFLANTKGVQENMCLLQKYASRITSDCIVKDISLTSMSNKHNYKHPLHRLTGVGYMPGEIYSFGIIYVFEDGTESPVYHIPGVSKHKVYSKGDDTYPMSIDNEMSYKYPKKKNYWGKMYDGTVITEDTPVRHHRFPTRRELGIDLVKCHIEGNTPIIEKKLVLDVLYKSVPVVREVEVEEKDDEGNIVKVKKKEDVPSEVLSDNNTFILEIEDSGKTVRHTFSLQHMPLESTNRLSLGIYTTKDVKSLKWALISVIGGNEVSDVSRFKEAGFTDISFESIEDSYSSQSEGSYDMSTKILGIKFSNIDIPNEHEIGKKVVGYYIVRNNREDEDKTIIDGCLIHPMVKSKKYISHGLLMPEGGEVVKNAYAITHLENKFRNKFLDSFTSIDIDGYFKIPDRDNFVRYGLYYKSNIEEGSSYNGKKHKGGDDDGWDLAVFSRNNYVVYESSKDSLSINKYRNVFYLDALGSYEIGDKVYFNTATDNRVGVILFDEDKDIYKEGSVAYGIVKKNNSTAYHDFYNRPYYKENNNVHYFPSSNISLYQGDSYVSGFNLSNHMWYDNTVAFRVHKNRSLWSYIAAGALLVIGTLGLVFGGLGALAIVGGSLLLAGTTALTLATGLSYDNMVSAYNKHYKEGLRETILDRWVKYFSKTEVDQHLRPDSYARKYLNAHLDYLNIESGKPVPDREKGYSGVMKSIISYVYGQNKYYGGYGDPWELPNDIRRAGTDGFGDDCVKWFVDCISNVFLESSINTGLRNKLNSSLPSFIDFPNRIENSNNKFLAFDVIRGKQDADVVLDEDRPPKSELEKISYNKLLEWDSQKNEKTYRKIALGDFWSINEDYQLVKGIKPYYHLGMNYECDSPCRECFPHRVKWSERSYDEELADNYQNFKTNNYKDFPSDSGEITNIASLLGEMFVHTEYAFYKMPMNYQERVNDNMITYIGTGSLGELPAQKLLDSNTKLSAGLRHKLASVKTSSGYYFISDKEGKIYYFNGQLNPISNQGISYWCKDHLPINKEAIDINKPHLLYGSGYIIEQDPYTNRIVITKKEYTAKDDLYIHGGYIFEDYNKFYEDAIGRGYVFRAFTGSYGEFYRRDDKLSILRIKGRKIKGNEVNDRCFTLSFSLKTNSWTSFHSYTPNLYTSVGNKLLSIDNALGTIWEHNKKFEYQIFNGIKYPFIIEYAITDSPLSTNVFDSVVYKTDAYVYHDGMPIDARWETFNKAIFYNSRQCSGLVNLVPKDETIGENYMLQQVAYEDGVIIDRNERDWTINNFRDNRTRYDLPIFESLGNIRFSDKHLTQDYEDKHWSTKEQLRDKYLVARFIFDKKPSNIKLIYKYGVTFKTTSMR